MFERFTKRARRVLVLAKHEASALDHDYIGTEHLLLGLLEEGEGVAGRVLLAEGLAVDDVRRIVVDTIGRGEPTGSVADADALASIGIDLEQVTAAVEESFGEGALDRVAGLGFGRSQRSRRLGPPFTPRTKKALELSLREALELGHNYIGTEHLLLGTIRLGKGVAYDILAERLGPPERLRDKVLDELKRLNPGA